jgi:hypothetical protein
LRDTVEYPKGTILSAIRLINAVVVSMDRMGSAVASLPEPEQLSRLAEYEIAFGTSQKLAEARTLLHSVFSTELGPDDMDELERELADVEYWKPPPRE